MPLVVVHGDHRVIVAGAELDEDRIAEDRANYTVPVCHGLGDRRLRDVDVLPSEQATLTGMGVECGDRNAAAGDTEREQGLMVRSMT